MSAPSSTRHSFGLPSQPESVRPSNIDFTPAPGANVALTWSGTYYFRCRFQQDQQEFKEFMRQLWEAGSVKFRGSLGRKI